jgi:MFS family permease
VHGHYFTDLFPAFLISGLGLAFAFVPMSIGALTGVRPAEAGVASGLINTSQQIGGALGLAVLSSLATSHTSSVLSDGSGLKDALTEGFQIAFLGGSAIALLGFILTLVLIKGSDSRAHVEIGKAEAEGAEA